MSGVAFGDAPGRLEILPAFAEDVGDDMFAIEPLTIENWSATSIPVVLPDHRTIRYTGPTEVRVETEWGRSDPAELLIQSRASVTTWTRLELQARTSDLQEGLRLGTAAAVDDAAWMLGRQWQMFELQGEDAGSPVSVRITGEANRLSAWSAGPDHQAPVPPGTPLETVVERERVIPAPGDAAAPITDLRLAAELGFELLRQLARRLDDNKLDKARRWFLQRYAIEAPAPGVALDADSRSLRGGGRRAGCAGRPGPRRLPGRARRPARAAAAVAVHGRRPRHWDRGDAGLVRVVRAPVQPGAGRRPAGVITGVEVTDSFGRTTELGPFGDGAGADWRMFELAGNGTADAGDLLTIPDALPSTWSSRPSEELLLVRDELANLAWAVERVVESPTGRPLDRQQDEHERRPDDEPPPADGPLRYVLAALPPPNWYPLIPKQQIDADDPRLLARGRLRREDDTPILPRGRLLEPDRPLDLFEEEVPRAGARVVREWQMGRAPNGTTHLWRTRRKGAGRGEGSSGLRFDTPERPRAL